MLVRYKNMQVKPGGMTIVVPFSARLSQGQMDKADKILAKPFAEIPDADALALVKADPHNFELVKEGDSPEEQGVVNELDAFSGEGLELDADPVKKPVKKRGRKSKAQLAALSEGAQA